MLIETGKNNDFHSMKDDRTFEGKYYVQMLSEITLDDGSTKKVITDVQVDSINDCNMLEQYKNKEPILLPVNYYATKAQKVGFSWKGGLVIPYTVPKSLGKIEAKK